MKRGSSAGEIGKWLVSGGKEIGCGGHSWFGGPDVRLGSSRRFRTVPEHSEAEREKGVNALGFGDAVNGERSGGNLPAHVMPTIVQKAMVTGEGYK